MIFFFVTGMILVLFALEFTPGAYYCFLYLEISSGEILPFCILNHYVCAQSSKHRPKKSSIKLTKKNSLSVSVAEFASLGGLLSRSLRTVELSVRYEVKLYLLLGAPTGGAITRFTRSCLSVRLSVCTEYYVLSLQLKNGKL